MIETYFRNGTRDAVEISKCRLKSGTLAGPSVGDDLIGRGLIEDLSLSVVSGYSHSPTTDHD